MTATIHGSSSQKIYLLSDFHLGAPHSAASLEREKKVVAFLQSIEDNAAAIFPQRFCALTRTNCKTHR
jgi:UDP-2,3-diacylglucosamine hydrolase